MSKIDIDQIFHDRLHQATVPPPAFVWPEVERVLQRRRRRKLFFWTGLSLSLLGLGTALTFYYTTSANPMQIGTVTEQPADSGALTATNPAPANTYTLPAQGNTQPQTADQPIVSKKETPTTNDKLSALNDKKTTSNDKAGLINNKSKNQQKARSTNQNQIKNEGVTAKAQPAQHLSFSEKKQANTISGAAVFGLDQPVDGTVKGILPADAATPVAPVVVPADIKSSAPADDKQAEAVQPLADAVDQKATLPTQGTSILSTLQQTGNVSPMSGGRHTLVKKNKHCYDFAEHRSAWLFDAYAGPSVTRKTLTAKTPEMQAFRQKRNATERSSLAFNGGLRGTYLFHEQLLLRVGVHYEQFTEVFEYVDPTSIQYIISQIYNQQTGTWKIDTIDIKYGEEYLKTYNRFGLLDIPVEIGYELRSGRSGVSINAGASANVLFWKRGAQLDPATDEGAYFTPGRTDAQQVFRTNAGLSAHVSAQWFWHLRSNTRLFAEPYYRRILRPVSLSGYPLQQRYGIGGLKVGITRIL